jgi:hypothetical protein
LPNPLILAQKFFRQYFYLPIQSSYPIIWDNTGMKTVNVSGLKNNPSEALRGETEIQAAKEILVIGTAAIIAQAKKWV